MSPLYFRLVLTFNTPATLHLANYKNIIWQIVATPAALRLWFKLSVKNLY
jgi:hypothetical protein